MSLLCLTLDNAPCMHCFRSVQLDIRCVLVFLLALRTTSIWTAIPKVNSIERRSEEPDKYEPLSSPVSLVLCICAFVVLPTLILR